MEVSDQWFIKLGLPWKKSSPEIADELNPYSNIKSYIDFTNLDFPEITWTCRWDVVLFRVFHEHFHLMNPWGKPTQKGGTSITPLLRQSEPTDQQSPPVVLQLAHLLGLGEVVGWFGFWKGFPLWKGLSLRVNSLESQTTGPQTTHLPLVE